MDDLDDFGITLTVREVEMILDTLDQALNIAGENGDDEEVDHLFELRAKITNQTGVR